MFRAERMKEGERRNEENLSFFSSHHVRPLLT